MGEITEQGGTRKFIREHVPGTEAHQMQEAREGEETHDAMHHHEND